MTVDVNLHYLTMIEAMIPMVLPEATTLKALDGYEDWLKQDATCRFSPATDQSSSKPMAATICSAWSA